MDSHDYVLGSTMIEKALRVWTSEDHALNMFLVAIDDIGFVVVLDEENKIGNVKYHRFGETALADLAWFFGLHEIGIAGAVYPE